MGEELYELLNEMGKSLDNLAVSRDKINKFQMKFLDVKEKVQESETRTGSKMEMCQQPPRKYNDDVASNEENLNSENDYRILHCNNNPFNKHLRKQREQIVTLIEENKRLSARLSLLEAGKDADITRKIEDAMECSQELDILRKQVKEAEVREAKIMASFKKTSKDFRTMCYLLTGFRIDALKERKYRLSSMYAESPDDVLYFETSPDGSVQLLRNEYSERLSEYVETYLQRADSFPAFLASITMDLFKASTLK